jgi:molybdopterin converting factor small subunit
MAAAARTGVVALELPEGADVSAVRPALERKIDRLPWPASTMLAVNQEYVVSGRGEGHRLKDGDEVASIPPVSGGGA